MRTAPLLRLLMIAAVAAPLASGCAPPQGREAKRAALARWEDRRLADPDSLSRMLRDHDAQVRLAAARTAGRIGRPSALTDLIGLLADEPSSTVRAEAATALGLMGDPAAAAPLIAAYGTRDRELRRAVLFALARVPSDGKLLTDAALHAGPDEAALAWNALRDRARDLDRESLGGTIRAGLVRPEADVLWRVLRCAERDDDPDLTAVLAPFARSDVAQVRVHAYRALAARSGDAAYDALIDGGEHADRFRGRDARRVRIALMRALGRRGAEALRGGRDAQPLVAQLTAGARDDDASVARTALEAMASLADGFPLPAAARERASLLPLWRLRLLESAYALIPQLGGAGSAEPAVRAAAATACIALRGDGFVDDPAWPSLSADDDPLVREAVWDAMARRCWSPSETIARARTVDAAMPERLRLTALAALTGAWDRLAKRSPADSLPPVRVAVVGALERNARGAADAPAAQACGLLGRFPSATAVETLLAAWRDAHGSGAVDVRRGVLEALSAFAADSTFAVPDSLRVPTTSLLEAGFDAPVVQLRTEARAAAVALGMPAPDLIPDEASLVATLPAFVRDPRQAPLALPFDAPHLRCETPRGAFTIALNGRIAPNTCATILQLVRQGFYDSLTFHRVVPDFVIQGGDPTGTGWGGPGFTIRSEWSRIPFGRGTVGIAHSGKDTGGSQFFVCLSPQPHLDGRYTVFGEVVDGMEVADSIQPDDPFTLRIQE